MIKNVIFDIGKVLIKFEWNEYMESLFEDEATRKAVSDAVWQSGWWTELDRNVIPEEEVFSHLRESAGQYAKSFDIAMENFHELIGKRDYATAWVKELKSLGYNVYFLSNYSDFIVRSNPDALEFKDYMDGGVFSYEEKIIKPNREIYECICNKYGLKPEECLFTDDSQKNVDAARDFGMRAIRFDGYDIMYPVIMEYLKGPDNGKEIGDLPGDGLPFDGMDFSKWGK
ncbi:MAG: HAD family phosphatase [Lachnospiraceae bacterium]|nr:HAD family phosphatase [Lachnospiraceae bacterium]